MAFSILNNISSLQAQQYLGQSERFQSKTISRVTSGLRIVSSGDDAAGLAIANGIRSDIAVLNQGIRNANDGLATLQTIDGGISQLLDRARTLSAQSASGTYTGSREVLNSEFQSVVQEIDRQAQAIGLDAGGQFAKSLSVFIGGGRANSGSTAIQNGSVAVNLSNSTVDAKSLGLKGTQALGNTSVDIGTGSATTSVASLVADATNAGSLKNAGYTQFTFKGPGFGDSNQITVSVNLAGVTDTDTLTQAINSAIGSAGNGTTAAATAFRNAGISASVNTSSNGTKQLAFDSSSTAFQVSAGDRLSNALLGNISAGATGGAVTATLTGGSATAAGALAFGASGTVKFRFEGSGLSSPVDVSVDHLAATTVNDALTALSSVVASNTSLQKAGISLTTATGGSALVFTSDKGEKFTVQTSGDILNAFGLGTYRSSGGASGAFDYSTVTGASGTFAASAETLEISIGGGAAVSLAVTPGAATIAGATTALNEAIIGNAALTAAGLRATNDGTDITLSSSNGTSFRLNTVGSTNVFGFNSAGATGVADVAEIQGGAAASVSLNSGGAYQTSALGFSGITLGTDEQTVTISANNASGETQSLAVVLRNDGTARNARSLDEAISTINSALQQSNNSTLQKIVAVKENDGGTEKLRFVSSVADFKIGVGTNGSGSGVASQGTVVTASLSSGGSTADISSQQNAQAAVNALGQAVEVLGNAQAVVGRGQNQFNFAVNLASSQLTNLAASESRIRDADLASEAAISPKLRFNCRRELRPSPRPTPPRSRFWLFSVSRNSWGAAFRLLLNSRRGAIPAAAPLFFAPGMFGSSWAKSSFEPPDGDKAINPWRSLACRGAGSVGALGADRAYLKAGPRFSTALMLVLQRRWDRRLFEYSYGFRPRRPAH